MHSFRGRLHLPSHWTGCQPPHESYDNAAWGWLSWSRCGCKRSIWRASPQCVYDDAAWDHSAFWRPADSKDNHNDRLPEPLQSEFFQFHPEIWNREGTGIREVSILKGCWFLALSKLTTDPSNENTGNAGLYNDKVCTPKIDVASLIAWKS